MKHKAGDKEHTSLSDHDPQGQPGQTTPNGIPLIRGPISPEDQFAQEREEDRKAKEESDRAFQERQVKAIEEANRIAARNTTLTALVALISFMALACTFYQARMNRRSWETAQDTLGQMKADSQESGKQFQVQLAHFDAGLGITGIVAQHAGEQAQAAGRNADSAQRALKEAQTQFVRNERPYIWHDTLEGDDSSPLFVGIKVYYTNYGKSPALRFSSTGHVFCSEDALAEAYRYLERVKKKRNWDNINTVQPPSISQGLPTPNRGYDTFVSDPQPPEQRLLCAGPNPALPRIAVGAWEYYDLAGNRYYGEFCNGVHLGIKRGYDASGNCDEHNELE